MSTLNAVISSTSARSTDVKTPARLLLIGAMTALSACSGSESDPSRFTVRDSAGIEIVTNLVAGGWAPEEAPRLVEELRIGTVDGDENYQFGMIAALEVDAEGNIYVLDFQAREVKVFDPNGLYLRRMGRRGSGPGELGTPAALILRGDTAGVLDMTNRRLQWFGSDGADAGTIPFELGSLSLHSIAETGEMFAQFRDMSGASVETALTPRDAVLRYDRSGAVVDTILTLPPNETVRIEDGTRIIPIVGGGSPVWGLAHGQILSARSSDMRFEVRSHDGVLTRIVTLDLIPAPMSEERQERLRTTMENLRRTLSNLPGFTVGEVEVRPFHPVIQTFLAGPQGTVWTARMAAEGAQGVEWSVFDSDGRYRGALEIDGFSPMRSVDDRVYGVTTDDLGVNYVVRMKIEGL